MKTTLKFSITLIIMCFTLVYGQEMDDMNYDPNLLILVEKYKKEEVPSDFQAHFDSSDDKENFKKMRLYLEKKKELKQLLYSALNDILFEERKKSSYKEQVQSLTRRIKDRPDSIYMKDIYVPELNYDGYYMKITPKMVKDDIIPKLEALDDDLPQIIKERKQLSANIDIVDFDISSCEDQIDITLAPDYQKQEFRRDVSTWFTALIALLLIFFFGIIYSKSDDSIGKVFLGDNGLQFITLFVLIIAVILFGILGILEATELAAILSGISGYILGRGANNRNGDSPPDIQS